MKNILFITCALMMISFTAQSQNNVGIGTTMPTSTLDIVGTTTTLGFIMPTGATNNFVLTSDASGNATWINPATLGLGVTLDQAYDFGGAGMGRTLNASDGAVRINGFDGFIVTGTFETGDDIEVTGGGTRMFFNPKKAAFRAGDIGGAQWDPSNIGVYSNALGTNTTASGDFGATAIGVGTQATGDFGATALGNQTQATGLVGATALGYFTLASGDFGATALGTGTQATGKTSTAIGDNTFAESGYEIAIGRWNTDYTPISVTDWNADDRLFVIGNGTSEINRSNAMVVLKNGNTGIGTSTPVDKLEVAGGIHAHGYQTRTGTNGIYGAEKFNIHWTGTNADLYMDGSNVGTISFTSDRRLKDRINPSQNNAIDRVMSLNPVSFYYKNIEGTLFKESLAAHEGFIADELQAIIPSAVNGEKDALTSDGTMQPQTVNIIPVVSVMTKAMQEQQAQIEKLQAQVERQQRQIDALILLLSPRPQLVP